MQTICALFERLVLRTLRLLRHTPGIASLVLAAAWPVSRAQAQVAPTTLPQTAQIAPTTLPQGGQVVQGQATLQRGGVAAAPVLNIDQSSARAVIDWQRFDLGAAATVNFNQPNAQAATLNRVGDLNPSQILGRIQAPGQVTLINPAGVYFGRDSVLDVGALTATTLQQSNADFMAGGANFSRGGSVGSVVNDGTLKAGLDGYIALLAPEVRNQGLIVAQQGAVVLAGGDAVRLNFDPLSRLASITVAPSTVAALVENRSAVQAPGGQIILSATAVNQLMGSVVNAGTLDASSVVSRGGRIVLEGDRIALTDTSRISATGATGGGTVLVGGDWQGSGPMVQARQVTMDGGAVVDASATAQGDGGSVVLWADAHAPGTATQAHGTLLARGGAAGGDGGRVETSAYTLDTAGIRVDAGALQAAGKGGLWLLDPADSTITQTVANGYQATLNTGTSVLNDVAGSIAWNNGVTLNKTTGGDATLTLRTGNGTVNGRNITLNGATIGSTSNALNLVLWTRYNALGYSGTVDITGSTIDTHGGHLWIGGGTATTWNGLAVGNDRTSTWAPDEKAVHLRNSSITTGAGDIAMYGLSYQTGSNNGVRNFGVHIDAGTSLSTTSGHITLDGLLQGQYTNGAGIWIGSSVSDVVAGNVNISSGSGAIDIVGRGEDQAGSGSGWRHALALATVSASDTTTVRSGSGAIALRGTAAFGAGGDFTSDTSGVQLQAGGATNPVNVVSGSGAITLSGQNSQESGQYENALRLTNGDAANSIRIGTDGTTPYSGNILIEADSILQRNNQPGAGSFAIQSTGTLTIAPKGSSFTALRAGNTGTLTFDNDWNFGGALGGYTLGKVTNTAALTLSDPLSVAGPISVYGGPIALQSSLTSSATGDIWIQSNSSSNAALVVTGSVLKTGGGRSTLTLRADGRVNVGGSGIGASGAGTLLDTVLWSDYKNTGSGGTTIGANIGTNGGHLWAGGSASNGGSMVWNGLTVGNGPSEGASGYNFNALDLSGAITTGGGNLMLWGGEGYSSGIRGIGLTAAASINTGSGNLTLIGDQIAGSTLALSTTGRLTLAPHGGDYGGAFNWNGSTSGGNFTTSGWSSAVTINGFANLGGLTLGRYTGTGLGGDTVIGGITNSSNVSINSAIGVAGPLALYGGNVDINANLLTTGAGAAILAKANGNVATSAGTSGAPRTLQTNNGAITLWSDANVAGVGYVQLRNYATLNSANGSVLTSAGGGGDITIGGGAGTTAPTGFATATLASPTTDGNVPGGVILGTNTQATATNLINFYSGGGAVSIAGASATAVPGLLWYDGGTIQANGGTIALQGRNSSTGHGLELLYYGSNGTTTLRSSAGGTAISLTGTATASTGSAGLQSAVGSGLLNIESTGSGAVSIVGTSASASYDAVVMTRVGSITSGGAVTITGDNDATSGNGIGLRFGGSITTTGAGAGISLASKGSVMLDAAAALTSNNAPLTLWSDRDGSGGGHIAIGNGVALNSANGQSSQASGGGRITLAGGSAVDGAGLPTGFASSTTVHGVSLGSTAAGGVVIRAGGGDVLVNGSTTTNSSSGDGLFHGVVGWGALTVDAGQGAIAMSGTSTDSYGLVLSRGSSVTTTNLRSAKASGTAITLAGTTMSTNTHGLVLDNDAVEQIIASGGGAIALSGSGNGSGYGVWLQGSRLLASSGAITVDGGSGGINFAGADSRLGRYTSDVLTSSSPITLTGDRLTVGGSGSVASSGMLAVQPASASFSSALSWPLGLGLSTDIGGLQLGKDGNTANVTIGAGTAVAGDIRIVGGALALNGALTTTGTLTLAASGNVTQSAALNVGGLLLKGTGASHTLTNALNQIGTLAADSGSLDVVSAGALTIGTVAGTNGINASGTVAVATVSGDLTVAQNVATASAVNNAVLLNAGRAAAAGSASGGNLLVSAGKTVGTGSGGRALLYSGSVAGSTGLTALVGSGSGRFRYDGDEAASNFSAALPASGLAAIYREAPAVSLAIGDSSMVYGDALALPAVGVVSGTLRNGDLPLQVITGRVDSGAGQIRASATPYALTTSNLQTLGYSVGVTPGSLTVSRKPITAGGVTVADKVYDGSTAATLNGAFSLPGVLSGDAVSVSGGSASFVDKNAGVGKTVVISGLTPAGADAANYQISAFGSVTATITPKPLTASASGVDKVYDGSTAGTALLSISGGLVGTETLLASGSGSFDSKDVLTAHTVTVASTAVADGTNGGLASNYSLAPGQTATAHITPRPLTATAVAPDKVYDGNTAGSALLSISSGLVGSETLLASSSASFNSKDVLTAHTVTVASTALADGSNGGLASNYSLAPGQTATAHITPRPLTATAMAPDKVYDGSTAGIAALSISNGLVGTETLLASGNASFNSKDVLTAHTVTVASTALADGSNGGLASNYSLAPGQTDTAHITPRPLTATAVAPDRVYDGSTASTAALTINGGLVGTETLLASGSASFNSKDVLTAHTVTVASTALADSSNGGLASNYSLAPGQTATAHITPRPLTATAVASDKVYDASTVSTAALSISGGLVGSETLLASGSASFNSKDVLTAHTVTVASTALADGTNGGLASNYSLAPGQTATAHIAPRPLTATAVASDKVYDGSTASTATLSINGGLVGTETLLASGSASFNSKDVLTAHTVTVASTALADGSNGGLASNYSLAPGQTATAHITPRPLTATAMAPDKVYDGSTASTAALTINGGLVGTETLLSSGSASFNSKDVLTAHTVTVASLALADGTNGGLASNYSLAPGQTATAHIAPRPLTATAVASDKVYDGSTASTAALTINGGLVGTETLLASGSASFNSKDVLTAHTVTVASTALADSSNGGLASNYSLAPGQTATAHITPRPLTATAMAPDKVYDGNTAGSALLSISSGLVGSETLLSSGSASFNSKDVLTAHTVTVASTALADGSNGGLASNYSLAPGQTATAHITPRPLTATAMAPDKVYDGSTAGIAALSISNGLVGTETLLASGSASFNSKDVLTAHTVTVASTALADGTNGGLASNYSLAPGQTATAHITPRPLTATAMAPDKVYDGSTAGIAALSISNGLVGTETLLASGSASFNSKDVLTAHTVTVASTALADGTNGGLASNYSLAPGQTATAHITPRPLTATAMAPDKVYDGSTAGIAALSISSGLVGTETLLASGSASFNSKDVLTAHTVTVASTALADGSNGGLASNYSLAPGQTATAHITPRPLTATAVAPDRVYDGSTASTAALSISNGLVGTETLLASSSASFDTKDVLTAHTVTVTSTALADGSNGGLASNYSLAPGQTATAHITPKAAQVQGITAADKVYDGGVAAAVDTQAGSLNGLVAGDSVSIAATGSYADRDAGVGKPVALVSSYGGVDRGNYAITDQTLALAAITPKPLTLAGSSNGGRTYDGTTSVGGLKNLGSGLADSGLLALVGVVGGDSVQVLGAPALDAAGAGLRSIVQGTVSIAGTDAHNYSLQWSNGSAVVAKAPLLVRANDDARFVTQADATGFAGAAYAGFVNGETAAVLGGSLAVSRSNAGNNAADSYAGVLQAGGLSADNYTLTYSPGDYTIVPANRLLVRLAPVAFSYGSVPTPTVAQAQYLASDNSTIVDLSGSTSVSGSRVSVNDGAGGQVQFDVMPRNAVFSGANLLQAGSYQVAASGLTGTSGNFSNTLTLTGVQTVTTLGVAAQAGSVSKVYDGSTGITGVELAFTGIKPGDRLSGTASGAFASRNAGSGIAYSLTGLGLSGADAINYHLTGGTALAGSNGTITPRDLVVSGIRAADKVYDGGIAAAVDASGTQLQGLVSGDVVTVAAGGSFADKHAGVGKTVLLNSSYGGSALGNYRVIGQAATTASITPKALTVAGLAATAKVYDGLLDAAIDTSGVRYEGLVSGDTVTTTASGRFADRHAGIGKAVAVTSSHGGADLGNYQVADQLSTTADITPKELLLAGASGIDKTYDGRTELPQAASAYGAVQGVLSGDSVAVTGTAIYDRPDAGLRSVQQGSLRLTGAEAANYALRFVDGSGAIAQAALTVTANPDVRFVTRPDAEGYAGVAYSGFVNGETPAVLGGVLRIARTDPANLTAGTYPGVLMPGGLNAANYAVRYVPGDYSIVPANQLLVRVTPVTSIYGDRVDYAITDLRYLDAQSDTIIDLRPALQGSGNHYSVSDGANGRTAFDLAALNGSYGSAGALNVGRWQLGGTAVSSDNANLRNGLFVIGTHQVDPKSLTVTSSGATKVYDGSTAVDGIALGLTGLVGTADRSDRVTLSGVGAFASANAGTGIGYTVSDLRLQGADAPNYTLQGADHHGAQDGVILPKAVTLMAPVVSKVYDGHTGYTASVTELAALSAQLGVARDSVAALKLNFDDKNVGTDKRLTPGEIRLDDGNGGANYRVTAVASSGNAVTRLASVAWVGGAAGNWFDPADWAGGAVPDRANVAVVQIPAGVRVEFGSTVVGPAEAGPVRIERLGDEGRLALAGGELQVGDGGVRLQALEQSGGVFASLGPATLGRFTQSGGSTTVHSDFAVQSVYRQSGPGTVQVEGRTTISGTEGGVRLGNLTSVGGLTVTSTDGDITQLPGTRTVVRAGSVFDASVAQRPADIRLAEPANDFVGPVDARGATVSLADANVLELGSVRAAGDLMLGSGAGMTQTGPITVAGRSTLDAGSGSLVFGNGQNRFDGVVDARGGSVAISGVANDPAAQGDGRLRAAGALTAAWLSRAGTVGVSAAYAPFTPGSAGVGFRAGRLNAEPVAGSAPLTAVQIRNASSTAPGMSMVRLNAAADAGFEFEMTGAAAQMLQAAGARPTATLADGSPLPDWLAFDAARLRFSARRPQAGALPLQIDLAAGVVRWRVEISAAAAEFAALVRAE